jgi:hypothetical protein
MMARSADVRCCITGWAGALQHRTKPRHTIDLCLFIEVLSLLRKTTGFVMSAAMQLGRQLTSKFEYVGFYTYKQQRRQNYSSMVQKILAYVKKSGHVRPNAESACYITPVHRTTLAFK